MPIIGGVNTPRLHLALAALRSGLYPQSAGCLHRTEPDDSHQPGWCCLGVFTDIAVKIGGVQLERVTREGMEFFSGEHAFLHPAVADFYGFTATNPMLCFPDGNSGSASSLNDYGFAASSAGRDDGSCENLTFSEIADAFEYTYITGGGA